MANRFTNGRPKIDLRRIKNNFRQNIRKREHIYDRIDVLGKFCARFCCMLAQPCMRNVDDDVNVKSCGLWSLKWRYLGLPVRSSSTSNSCSQVDKKDRCACRQVSYCCYLLPQLHVVHLVSLLRDWPSAVSTHTVKTIMRTDLKSFKVIDVELLIVM